MDVIVKIMVEVLSILGIVTKEIGQGKLSMSFRVDSTRANIDLRAEKFFKMLAGMKDVEDALQRLDKLTREEVLMAVAEGLTITREIDDKVEGVDHKIDSVNEGEPYYLRLPPKLSSAFYSVRCKRERSIASTSGQTSRRREAFVIF